MMMASLLGQNARQWRVKAGRMQELLESVGCLMNGDDLEKAIEFFEKHMDSFEANAPVAKEEERGLLKSRLTAA
jgi:hypothetical protein